MGLARHIPSDAKVGIMNVRILREPLLHFLLIGAAIYLAFGMFSKPAPEVDDKTIVLGAGEIAWMQATWQKTWNRPPSEAEMQGIIQQYIRETVFYREALTMGLNQHDPVIRRRLAQKLEFLAKDLVQLTPPSEADLRAYFDAHQDLYQLPPRYTFTQVFLDPNKRGEATLDDAQRVKAELIALGDDLSNAGALSDGYMLQSFNPDKAPLQIRKDFGGRFAEALMGLEPGKWQGPVQSGFGVHLVYVSAITQPPAPAFAEMHERVAEDWKVEKGEELNKKFYENLRKNYTIVIESPSGEGNVDTSQELTQ